ncbi:hypothetical protein TNCV_2925891 [Trichonephila clavipes]|nr:hypothetical protein TNCV_2925891 [Trichonephila clavipes]
MGDSARSHMAWLVNETEDGMVRSPALNLTEGGGAVILPKIRLLPRKQFFVTVPCDLAQFLPGFEEEHPVGGQWSPTFLPFSPSSREDLRLDDYLKYPPAAKALYIYKHPSLLRDSNPGPKLEIFEALPTNKSILTDDEDNSAVNPLAKRSKRYNPPAIHAMAFILAIPG